MIKVSVFYPNSSDGTFDMPYYLNSHIPMGRRKLGAALKGVSVEEGLAGGAPGAPATYSALGHLLFDSVDAFQQAWAVHGDAIVSDVPNYTNTQPIIQLSEVKL